MARHTLIVLLAVIVSCWLATLSASTSSSSSVVSASSPDDNSKEYQQHHQEQKTTEHKKSHESNNSKKKKSRHKKTKRTMLDTIKGEAISGVGTYYNAGPGSCGETDTNDELVVAINKPQMHNGPNPNINPHCNKYVYVKGTNGETKARIVDTCPLCPEGCLDLSPTVFQIVCGDLSKGKCEIHWKFM